MGIPSGKHGCGLSANAAACISTYIQGQLCIPTLSYFVRHVAEEG